MGGAGRNCGQLRPDGVLSCATEQLSLLAMFVSKLDAVRVDLYRGGLGTSFRGLINA